MKKIMVFALLAAFVMPMVVSPVFAEEAKEMVVTNVGNKLCPVSGKPVSGQYFLTHDGKRYGLCCPLCDTTFLGDPAKYIAKMKSQEASATGTESAKPSGSKNGIY